MLNGKKPLLGAVLIVKNEAVTIERTVDSCIKSIDAMTVLDTGSTDRTQDFIRRQVSSTFPLVQAAQAFVDYATARNRVLAIAEERNPTVFTLTLSADETLVGGDALRTFLEEHRDASEGAYSVMMRQGPRQWPFPRILRTGAGWKYVNAAGKRHEQPVGPDGEEIHAKLIPGVFVVHSESDPERKHARLLYQDLPDLTAVVADESKSLSERLESMLQLAETHFVVGEHEHKNADKMKKLGGQWLSHFFASMAMYSRFAGIAESFALKMKEINQPDWQFLFQRAMYAQLMYLQVAETFGLFEPSELVKRLDMVAQMAPQLPEAHWALARNAALVDVRKAIPLAMRSAKVARMIYDKPVLGPVDITLEWQSLRLAAECARVIKDKRLQHSFAKQALAAGAPLELMGELCGPVELV